MLSNRPVDATRDMLRFGAIADGLETMLDENDDSVILGITGGPGMGTSSLLKILADRVSAKGATVVEFDCLLFASFDSLERAILEQIGARLDVRLKDVAGLVSKLLGAVNPAARLLPILAAAGEVAEQATSMASDAWTERYVPRLESEIREKLTNRDNSIWLFIDNADRWPSDRLTSLTRAIHSASRLPRTKIAIAYARNESSIFRNVVDSEYSIGPLPAKELEHIVKKWLNELGYSTLMHSGPPLQLEAVQLLPNLSAVKGWLNDFAVLERLLHDEVYAPDLLHFKLIETCAPQYGELLFEFRDYLTGNAQPYDRKFFSAHPELFPEDKPALLRLLLSLFPRARTYYNQWITDPVAGADERRIYSVEYCDHYFAHRINIMTLPDRSLLEAVMSESMGDYLIAVQEQGLMSQLLDLPFRRPLDPIQATRLFEALLMFFSRIEGDWMFGQTLQHRAIYTLVRLSNEREELLKKLIEECPWYAIGAVYWLFHHGLPGVPSLSDQNDAGIKARLDVQTLPADWTTDVPQNPSFLQELVSAQLDQTMEIDVDEILNKKGLSFLLFCAKRIPQDDVEVCLSRLKPYWDSIEKFLTSHPTEDEFQEVRERIVKLKKSPTE